MVKVSLEISAKLENIKEIGVCGPDFRYYIKTQCSNCGETADKWQYVCLTETHTGRTGRSDVHMKAKCKGCQREVSLVILEDSIKSYVFDEDKEENFQPIVTFEVRGVDVLNFDFRVGWTVKALNSTTVFNNVDFTDTDWADYDEKAEESVAVYGINSRIVKA